MLQPIPDDVYKVPFGVGCLDNYKFRKEYVRRISWAIPYENAVKEIASFVGNQLVVELGAGTGIWAALLAREGVNIKAFDVKGFEHEYNDSRKGLYFPVEILSPNKIKIRLDYLKPEVLFFCWPSYDLPWANDYLTAILPNKVVYIGEGCSGCTGDENFHDTLRDKYHGKYVWIPHWLGLHDHVNLLERRSVCTW
jgi:hypothetical protein